MSAPLSFASLNLDKNQTMPLQARKKQAKKAEPVAAAAAPAAVAPVVKEAKKEVAKKAAPAAAPKKAEDESADESPAASPKADEKEKKAPVPRTHYSGYAMVKAVLSGDSLVLAGSTVGGVETPEKLVSLTGVLAPKFGRGKNQVDEPFAWESREYLRKHVSSNKQNKSANRNRKRTRLALPWSLLLVFFFLTFFFCFLFFSFPFLFLR